jgi:hypothetical protein
MNLTLPALAFIAIAATSAYADENAGPATLTPAQAQARQFGMFLGGTATQYDLCVKKGFLPAGNPSAEDSAKSMFEKVRASASGPDQSAFVQDGWDTIKKEILGNEAFFTQQKCTAVGKEWAKIVATMHAK